MLRSIILYSGALTLIFCAVEIYAGADGKRSPVSSLSKTKSFMRRHNPIDTRKLMSVKLPEKVAETLCEWDSVERDPENVDAWNKACHKECKNLSRAARKLRKSHPKNFSIRGAYRCMRIKEGWCEFDWDEKQLQKEKRKPVKCMCERLVYDRDTGEESSMCTTAATCRYKIQFLAVLGNAEILGRAAARRVKNKWIDRVKAVKHRYGQKQGDNKKSESKTESETESETEPESEPDIKPEIESETEPE